MGFLEDIVLKLLLGILLIALAVMCLGGASALVDSTYFEYKAFDAIAACETKRMDYRRKSFSTNVVCIPAYRQTKNDTLSINLNK
jgi:hypothetical protein